MRILYVEDNQANLFLVQRVARMGGHEVISYTTGESALANFDRDKPHLILMDVQLAGELSGLDVVKRLRASGHQTPVVAVTAYAMVGDREKCMEAGCDGYLSKPLPVTELVELIKKYEAQAQAKAAQPAPAEISSEPAKPEATQSAPAETPTEPAKPEAAQSAPTVTPTEAAQSGAVPVSSEVKANPAQSSVGTQQADNSASV